jgi:hypothetical protein
VSKNATAADRKTLSARMGASPKLLQRKALEKAEASPSPDGAALEDSFPADGMQDEMPVLAPEPVVDATAAEQPAPINAAESTDSAEPVSPAPMPDAPAQGDTPEPAADAPAPVDIIEPATAPEPAAPAPIAAPPAKPAPIVGAPTWSAQDEAEFQTLSARRKASGYRGRGKELSTQLIRMGEIKPNPGTVVATIVGLVPEHGTMARGELVALMAAAAFESPKARPTDTSWCQGYVAGAIRSGFLAEGTEPLAADQAA